MRLIDADELKDRVGYIEEEYGHIMEEINNAPTVEPIKVGDVCKECWRDGGNVVEVVRCKDCCYWLGVAKEKDALCSVYDNVYAITPRDGFCHKGRRSE